MRPNPERQIKKLQESVSWLKGYYCISDEVEWPTHSVQYNFNCFLLITDDNNIIPAVFCSGQRFWQAVDLMNEQFAHNERPYWLIVTSEISRKEIEYFFVKSNVKIVPLFLDPATEIEYNDLICDAMMSRINKEPVYRTTKYFLKH